MKEPYHVRLGEVRLVRIGETLQVHYPEPDIPVYNIHVGPELTDMTEQEVLDVWNARLRDMTQLAAEHKHIAVEVPLGSPQMEFHQDSGQWVPRGHVLRCVIHDEGNVPIVEIDGRQLTWEEFGTAVVTFAGWGMRVVFVPDAEVHRQHRIEVREPADV